MPIGKIEQFDLSGKKLSAYIRRVEQFMALNEIKSVLQVATLVTLVGEATYDQMCDLCAPDNPENKTFQELVKIVGEHLEPKRSEIAERHVFRTRRQNGGESLSDYLQVLKHLASTCNFKNVLEENLRDQFASGLVSDDMRWRLFAEPTLTYWAVEFAFALEAAYPQVPQIQLRSTCAKRDIILVDSIQYFPKDLNSSLKYLDMPKLVQDLEQGIGDTDGVLLKSMLENDLELKFYPEMPLDFLAAVEQTSSVDPKSEHDLFQLQNLTSESNKKHEIDEETNPGQNFYTEIESVPLLRQNDNSNSEFWNPWTISLVCIGALLIMSITGIASYQLGKMRGKKKRSSFIVDEEIDPQRIIPRVTRAHSNPIFVTP